MAAAAAAQLAAVADRFSRCMCTARQALHTQWAVCLPAMRSRRGWQFGGASPRRWGSPRLQDALAAFLATCMVLRSCHAEQEFPTGLSPPSAWLKDCYSSQSAEVTVQPTGSRQELYISISLTTQKVRPLWVLLVRPGCRWALLTHPSCPTLPPCCAAPGRGPAAPGCPEGPPEPALCAAVRELHTPVPRGQRVCAAYGGGAEPGQHLPCG